MSAECLRAQQAISRAIDGDPVSAEEAASAKRHCAECAECATFVRTLAQLKTVPTPSTPQDAVARIIEQGTALIEADVRAAAGLSANEPAGDSPAQPMSIPPEPSGPIAADTVVTAAGVSPTRRRSTLSTVGWATGIAAVLFAAMIVTAQGLRSINNPQGSDSAQDTAGRLTTVQEDGLSQQAPEATEEAPANTSSSAPGYVVFDSVVYRFAAIVNEDVQDLSRLGTSRTALDTGGTPQQRTVYESDSQDRILIEGNGIYAFSPVTRVFEGSLYTMRSDSIDEFGEWPTLPAGVPEPSEPDGSPVFEVAGQSLGVSIYTRGGRNADEGFAIAPNTAADDPADGNPGWTWWEPQD